jgi:hypothetical protein
MSELKTKNDFKNTFYLFHNYVNSKKRKRPFNYANLIVYNKYRLIDVVNNFIANYHTKGNMRMLTESFQRQFVVKDFKNWFTKSMKAFIKRVNIPPAIRTIKVGLPIVQEKVPIVQEEVPVVQESEVPVVQEEVPVVQEEVPIVQEEVPIAQEQEVPVVQEEVPLVQEEVPVVQESEVPIAQEEVPIAQEEISIAGIK